MIQNFTYFQQEFKAKLTALSPKNARCRKTLTSFKMTKKLRQLPNTVKSNKLNNSNKNTTFSETTLTLLKKKKKKKSQKSKKVIALTRPKMPYSHQGHKVQPHWYVFSKNVKCHTFSKKTKCRKIVCNVSK